MRISIAPIVVLLLAVNCFGQAVLQPGPDTSHDIWTTSLYSYSGNGSGPGGGLADNRLRVGGWGDEYRSLVQFDVSAMPQQAGSAIIELYCFSHNGGKPTAIILGQNTASWNWKLAGNGPDRERLWWSDLPSASVISPQPLAPPALDAWYAIDVTALYNAWQSNAVPNYGIQLIPAAASNNWNEFYSSRATDPSLRPKLTVIPVPEPAVAAICMLPLCLLRKRAL